MALAGYAAHAVAPLTVAVISVRLTEIGLERQRLAVALCASNPNDRAFDVSRVDVDLDVAGSSFLTSRSTAPVSLPANGTSIVPLDVTVAPKRPGTVLLRILEAGALPYRIHGTIGLEQVLFPIGFSRAGRLTLSGFARRALADPAQPGVADGCTGPRPGRATEETSPP